MIPQTQPRAFHLGAESYLKIRDEILAHMRDRSEALEKAFVAFAGAGFKIKFDVKIESVEGENVFEIDMSFDPLPKAKFRRVSKVATLQQRFHFSDLGGMEDHESTENHP